METDEHELRLWDRLSERCDTAVTSQGNSEYGWVGRQPLFFSVSSPPDNLRLVRHFIITCVPSSELESECQGCPLLVSLSVGGNSHPDWYMLQCVRPNFSLPSHHFLPL